MNIKTLKDIIESDPEATNTGLADRFGVYRATIRKFKKMPEKVLVSGDELFPSMKEFPTGRKKKDS